MSEVLSDHMKKVREMMRDAAQKMEEADRVRSYHQFALQGLRSNFEYHYLHGSGLKGHLVEYSGGRFIVDRCVATIPDNPLLEGRHVNRKGKASPTWSASATLAELKDLGEWKE